MIALKRAYEPPSERDGYRVLVERLWPRGVRKDELQLDAWEKELAPSTELRKWYAHDPAKWGEFAKRYTRELATPEAQQALGALAARAQRGHVTLLFAAHDPALSNATVLKHVIDRRLGAKKARRAPRARTPQRKAGTASRTATHTRRASTPT